MSDRRALKEGALRVIAGSAKGRRLAVPRGDTTRPTAERVREAVFSILAPRLAGARVLDLFAGSGALGIEALSRGAASAHFVDSDGAAAAAIRANTAGLEGCELSRRDAHAALAAAAAAGRLYDLVFIDPPYRTAARTGTELGQAIATVLAPGGLVVTESDRHAPMQLSTLRLTDSRVYGDTVLGFHEH